jgi:hypothetical protein
VGGDFVSELVKSFSQEVMGSCMIIEDFEKEWYEFFVFSMPIKVLESFGILNSF